MAPPPRASGRAPDAGAGSSESDLEPTPWCCGWPRRATAKKKNLAQTHSKQASGENPGRDGSNSTSQHERSQTGIFPDKKPLWDTAYEKLREEDEKLVSNYEELLQREARTPGYVSDGGDAVHALDGEFRQATLKLVIQQGMQRMEEKRAKFTIAGHEFVLRDQISGTAKLALWAKDLIGEATKASPEASIVLAGVWLILPLLTNPVTAEEANQDGFAYVSTRITYYTALEPLLQRLGLSANIADGLRVEAESHLIDLYRHILEFQIASVLRFYYSSLKRYTGDVLQRRDWQEMRRGIEKRDATVHQNLVQMNSLMARLELESLNKASLEHLKSFQKLLPISGEMLQVAKDQRSLAQEQLDIQKHAAEQKLSEEQQKCLHLFRLTDAAKDATYEWYMDRIEDRVEDTCQWFLQHDNFQAWLRQESGPLLVTADPGCGKSVLAKHLVCHVLPQPGTTVCYFFFKDQDQNTIRQALCAVLHQLLSKKSTLIKHAVEQFKKNGSSLVNSTSTLWTIFEDAIKDPQAGPVIVVLDALDECESLELENLTDNVKKQFCGRAPAHGNLRYLLTSRPYEEVISSLRALSQVFPHVRIPGEEESDTISKEVNAVVRYRVDRMDLPSRVKNRLRDELLKIGHRTYLWVYLVFDYLEKNTVKKTESAMMRAIMTLPKSVDNAYEQILQRSADPALARKALSIVIVATRPLTLTEMNVAVNMEATTESFKDLDLEEDRDFHITLREWCGLFLAIHHGKVYFLHQTAREFLLADPTPMPAETLRATEAADSPWSRSIVQLDAHRVLATACVRYLNFFNDSTTSGDKGRLFLDYSAVHWGEHFREAHFEAEAAIVPLVFAICDPKRQICFTWQHLYKGPRRRLLPGPSNGILAISSYFGLSEISGLLLATGSDANMKDDRGRRALHWAILRGHADVVKQLLTYGADVDVKTGDDAGSWTPLMLAASYGYVDIVKYLLDHKADVHAENYHGHTALYFAARRGSEPIAKHLLAHGAEVNTKDDGGWTPLYWAAYEGYEDVAGHLLKHGADVNMRDKNGWTPLLFAAKQGHWAVLELLLAHGADADAKDDDGDTLLSLLSPDEAQGVRDRLPPAPRPISGEDV
ncbi:hypothetical protein B0T16DRAFT_213792 [Cercophora newfieldiana]|uniref:NWD NACHT-NTPase N-terminal domain-containing protein n=1 Tax=Cercophora newfieldiana TaxID=92897 RepID=A0AA39XW34_9PEZI|nr:hypothetical protein B0T16DRAFT_213792 [Cercophora newfieldiana]